MRTDAEGKKLAKESQGMVYLVQQSVLGAEEVYH